MREIHCARCDVAMTFLKREKLQLGQSGWFFRDLPNLVAGAMEVDIYRCPRCGKIEFFSPGAAVTGDAVTCPECGGEYGTYLRECPHCGHARF